MTGGRTRDSGGLEGSPRSRLAGVGWERPQVAERHERHRIRKPRRATVMVLAGLLAAGCGSVPTPETHHYWIRRDAGPVPELRPEAPVLQITQTTTAPAIEGILVVRPDLQADLLVYHQWAAPVRAMVGEWMRQLLLESGAFSTVLPEESIAATDLSLHLRVQRFEILDRGTESPEAHVRLEGTLFRPGERRIAWTGTTEGRALAEGEGVPGLVEALERALDRAASDLVADLVAFVQAGPRSGG